MDGYILCWTVNGAMPDLYVFGLGKNLGILLKNGPHGQKRVSPAPNEEEASIGDGADLWAAKSAAKRRMMRIHLM